MSDRYADMTAILDQDALRASLASGSVHLVDLVSSKSMGVQEVFDLEVEHPEGLFATNGFIIHNCKESLLARGYTQIAVDESTGVIEVTFDNIDGVGPGRREVPSKTRVAFYDLNQERIVYGPLSVALVNQFPISTDSLEKLRKGQLTRLLAD